MTQETSEVEVTAPVEAPIDNQPTQGAPEVETEKPAQGSVRESIQAAVKEETEKLERTRDPKTGQFAKEPKEPKAPKETKPVEAAPEPAAPKESSPPAEAAPAPSTAIGSPPNGWSKEAKAQWASLSPDIQNSVLKREKEVSDGFAQYAPVKQLFDQPFFQQIGVQPADFVKNAISWHHAFANPQTREQAFRDFAASYGHNLSPDPNAPAPDITAQIPQLIQHQVQQAVAPIQTRFEQAQQEATAKEITAWAKDKPHFETVRTAMGQLMASGAAQTLDDAYQQAIWANHSIRDEMMKAEFEKQIKDQQEKAAKAKAAAISAPAKAPTVPPVKPNGKDKGAKADILAAIQELRERA